MTKEQVISVIRDQKPLLIRDMGVRSIGLFGSFARGEATTNSDIDILIDIETPDFMKLIAIKLLLEKQLGRTVDLHRRGPHLRKNFLEKVESEIIYA